MSGYAASGRPISNDGGVIVAQDLIPIALELLEAAEHEFGPIKWKNERYIGGVVLYGENPSTRFIPGSRGIAIVIPAICDTNDQVTLYSLAHEVVHCLYMDEEAEPPMIEEGAAVRFSIIGPKFSDPTAPEYIRDWHLTEPAAANYAEALLAVEQLLEINPEAIRILRREDPNWRAITPERIRAVAPGVSDQLAATLCEVRQMRPDDECELAAQQASSRHL